MIVILFFLNCYGAFAIVNAKMPPLYVSNDQTILLDGKEVTLRAGMPVVVEAIQTYSSKNISSGQTINVRVKYNVVVNKASVISAGALGNAIVSDVQKPKSFGRPGRMELQIQNVQAVDGQQVLLSGIPFVVEGENRKGLAWGVGIGVGLFTYGLGLLLGFAFKGRDAEFRSGTTLNSSVASDVEVEVEN